MSEASDIAQRISSSVPRLKSGTLLLFGRWFGRPYDNTHTIVGATAEDNCLVVRFDGGEVLRVWNPSGYRGDEYNFTISRTSRG